MSAAPSRPSGAPEPRRSSVSARGGGTGAEGSTKQLTDAAERLRELVMAAKQKETSATQPGDSVESHEMRAVAVHEILSDTFIPFLRQEHRTLKRDDATGLCTMVKLFYDIASIRTNYLAELFCRFIALLPTMLAAQADTNTQEMLQSEMTDFLCRATGNLGTKCAEALTHGLLNWLGAAAELFMSAMPFGGEDGEAVHRGSLRRIEVCPELTAVFSSAGPPAVMLFRTLRELSSAAIAVARCTAQVLRHTTVPADIAEAIRKCSILARVSAGQLRLECCDAVRVGLTLLPQPEQPTPKAAGDALEQAAALALQLAALAARPAQPVPAGGTPTTSVAPGAYPARGAGPAAVAQVLDVGAAARAAELLQGLLERGPDGGRALGARGCTEHLRGAVSAVCHLSGAAAGQAELRSAVFAAARAAAAHCPRACTAVASAALLRPAGSRMQPWALQLAAPLLLRLLRPLASDSGGPPGVPDSAEPPEKPRRLDSGRGSRGSGGSSPPVGTGQLRQPAAAADAASVRASEELAVATELCSQAAEAGPAALAAVAVALHELKASEAAQTAQRVLEACAEPQCDPGEAALGIGALLRRSVLSVPAASAACRTLIQVCSAILKPGQPAPQAPGAVEAACAALAAAPWGVATSGRECVQLLATAASQQNEAVAVAAAAGLRRLLGTPRLRRCVRLRAARALREALPIAVQQARAELLRGVPLALSGLYPEADSTDKDENAAAAADAMVLDPEPPEGEAAFDFVAWYHCVAPHGVATIDKDGKCTVSSPELAAAQLEALAAMVHAAQRCGAQCGDQSWELLSTLAPTPGKKGTGLLGNTDATVRHGACAVIIALVDAELSGGADLRHVMKCARKEPGSGTATLAAGLADAIAAATAAARAREATAEASSPCPGETLVAFAKALGSVTCAAAQGKDAVHSVALRGCLLAMLPLLPPCQGNWILIGRGMVHRIIKAEFIRAGSYEGGLLALFGRFPELFEPLFPELGRFNELVRTGEHARARTVAPMLDALGDCMDCPVEVFVLNALPDVLPWVVRQGVEPTQRLLLLGNGLQNLPDDKIDEIFHPLGRKVFGDSHALLANLVVHFGQHILRGILIGTRGEKWGDYVAEVRRQLVFVEGHSRGQYGEIVRRALGSVAKDVVIWAGKEDQLEHAIHALALLGLVGGAVPGSSGRHSDAGQGKSPFPVVADAMKMDDQYLKQLAAQQVDPVFYQIFDMFNDMLHLQQLQRSFTLAAISYPMAVTGVRCLHILLQLLGLERGEQKWEKYIIKCTPTLSACLRIYEHLQQRDTGELAMLFEQAWTVYIATMPNMPFVPHLGVLLCEVVSIARTVPKFNDLSARLLLKILDRTPPSMRSKWQELSHTIPETSHFDAVRARLGPTPKLDIRSALERAHQGLTNANREYRRVTLAALVSMLRERNNEIRELCEAAGRESSHLGFRSVANLQWRLLHLVARDRHHERDAVGWMMRCIGLLGAIAPALMQRKEYRFGGLSSERPGRVDDEALAVTLLDKYLVKAVQQPGGRGKTTNDTACCAVQELFKHLLERSRRPFSKPPPDCDVETEVRNYDWWNNLTKETQKRLQPYLTTQYKVQVVQRRDLRDIEYTPGMGFRPWFRAWMLNLVARTKQNRGKMMQTLRNVVKDDVDLGIYLLPFVLLNIVTVGSAKDHEYLRSEANAILVAERERPGTATEHCQVLCAALDQLIFWRNEAQGNLDEAEKQRKAGLAAGRHQDVREVTEDRRRAGPLNELLEHMDLKLMAQACSSHNPARALMYIEYHLRSVRENHCSVRTGATQQATQVQTGWCKPQTVRLFQDIYSRLGEPDGLRGIATIRDQAGTSELSDEALDLETEGSWIAAVQRYELLIERDGQELRWQRQMLRGLQHVGQYTTMLAFAEARPQLSRYVMQAAWRLGAWDKLGATISSSSGGSQAGPVDFEEGVANCLLALRRGDPSSASRALERARDGMYSELAAASLDSYEAAYRHIVRLHALEDLESAARATRMATAAGGSASPGKRGRDGARLSPGGGEISEQAAVDLLYELRRRAELGPARDDTLLAVRRALSSHLGRWKEVGRTWLEWGKVCRKRGQYQEATAALLRAECVAPYGAGEGSPPDPSSRPQGLLMQQAKLLWARGDNAAALRLVTDPVLEGHWGLRSYEPDYRAVAAQARLCALHWAQELSQRSAAEIIQEYEDIAQQDPSEMAYFQLARFMHRQWEEYNNQAGPVSTEMAPATAEKIQRKVGKIINYYSKALKMGTKRLYHALPRMLGIFFDTVTQLQSSAAQTMKMRSPQSSGHIAAKRAYEAAVSHLAAAMHGWIEKLPPYVLYAGLPQFCSRITNPSADVLEKVVGAALRRAVEYFPERAVWALMGLAFSKGQNGRKANFEKYVYTKLRTLRDTFPDPERRKRLERAVQLYDACHVVTDCINKLAEHPVESKPGNNKLRLDSLKFCRQLRKGFPFHIVVPTQEQLALNLAAASKSALAAGYGPGLFTPEQTFLNIDNEVAVMSSLQKPKRISVLTSTGEQRSFLCKANDELRKDARVMELCQIMNLLLAKNTETRQRQIKLRTFAVTMTGDESGMIEWVKGVEPVRYILDRLYLRSRYGLTTTEIRSLQKRTQGPSPELSLLDLFQKKLLPKFPAVFHRWFVERFPDPISWFEARNQFTKTTAVWSMVGHILGIGDRHGENILIDTETGEIMHVDFAIIFDKGLTLEVPEIVRFRLTRNIVDAMGIAGYEGIFRKCAELTMEVMRNHKDMVMGVLNLFLHDPLIDWTPRVKKSATQGQDGQPDWKPQAEQTLNSIRRRLDGYFDNPLELARRKHDHHALARQADVAMQTDVVALNVQGQVNKLIANATSEENLSKMYIWWMPWM
eukprot:TRINITY_DN49987_c0_g1_i1.p1 TRINITY_DN49987_c0_g1~~TRINITY_DN49987_c0_g1_i1.p1  ORF type:complete len:2908 (+),score=789.29 TRINITY_DN49987_c0_g1_i1:114-8726(+)